MVIVAAAIEDVSVHIVDLSSFFLIVRSKRSMQQGTEIPNGYRSI
jgi:hypothetical protein